MENKVDVIIGGEIVTLKSSESPEHLQRLSRYADEKIDEIKTKSKAATINERIKNLLITLNIADDFFKAQDKLLRLDSLHKRMVHEMGDLQDENMQIKEEVRTLKKQLTETKTKLDEAEIQLQETQAKLNEFIDSFDAENAAEGENILTLPQKPRKAR